MFPLTAITGNVLLAVALLFQADNTKCMNMNLILK